MRAGVTMSKYNPHAPRSRFSAGGRLGRAVRGLDPGVAVLLVFTGAMAWAFVGSLLLGLGTGFASEASTWLWLAGEMLIGAVISAVLILGVPPGRGGGA